MNNERQTTDALENYMNAARECIRIGKPFTLYQIAKLAGRSTRSLSEFVGEHPLYKKMIFDIMPTDYKPIPVQKTTTPAERKRKARTRRYFYMKYRRGY